MKTVVCVGEMLIDFVCIDTQASLAEGNQFIKKAGGAPANVAACIGQLGGKVSLVCAVGDDAFGHYLIEQMQHFHVNTEFVEVSKLPTTLAFVSLSDDGERDFAFNRGADRTLQLIDQDIENILSDSILHLGSATALLGGPLSHSYSQIAKLAKQQDMLICFDPNYRVDLWQGKTPLFRQRCDPFISLADIVKVSEEELYLLSSCQDFQAACLYFHQLGVKIVLVTLGSKGCLISQAGKQVLVPAYQTQAIDTTGAGDAFIGAILFQLAQSEKDSDFFADQIEHYVEFAQKVSCLVCANLGAMTALPTLCEVESRTFKLASQ